MQYKTSSSHFEKYGSVYEHPRNPEQSSMTAKNCSVTIKEWISEVLCFDQEVYIELHSGMAALIVSDTPDLDSFQAFALHRNVCLKPNIYFQIVSVTASTSYGLILGNDASCKKEVLDPAYHFNRILPKIKIREILGYYYSIRDSGYHFEGESHNYYELTYVDRGTLITTINDMTFEVKERELIIYGPGQFHTQRIQRGDSCSYITILFDMEVFKREFDFLLNKVFPYNKKIHSLLKTFANESSTFVPYMDSLLLNLLQEVIIRLLQSEYIQGSEKKPVTEVREHYRNELLERILTYIDDTIREPITIAEICQKFSMSRSSLQILFNENLNQSPKKYINELKLEKSRQMICENKYTISEIALMLGFNSIHYFSRAFTQKYHIAPSEYAKKIFKN